MRTDRRREALQYAWTGDAVLTLYAREMILREDGAVDGAKAARMTSNRFLTAFGEPTEVEAEIGRVYEDGGLSAAYAHIERRILPVFQKQEAKRPALKSAATLKSVTSGDRQRAVAGPK
jgi:hypothetical protein